MLPSIPLATSEASLLPAADRKTKTPYRRYRFKRRLKDAGLPDLFSPHSFRVAVVTDILKQDVSLEDVQYLAGHSSDHHAQHRGEDFDLEIACRVGFICSEEL